MNKLDLKKYLLSGQFLQLLSRRKYFSLKDIRKVLSVRYPDMTRGTLSRYMFELTKMKVVYNAGRGWYSAIDSPFEVDRECIKEIVDLLAKKYPLLVFSCWSTEQVKSYVHHMLSKFVTFIYTDWDSMVPVGDFLESRGYEVWVNPRGKDIGRFHVTKEKTVVILPRVSIDLADGHYALIEKILVDLLVEVRKLSLMDESEYDIVRANILESGRVDIGTLISYGRRRNVKIDEKAFRTQSNNCKDS